VTTIVPHPPTPATVPGVCFRCGRPTELGRRALSDQLSGPGLLVVWCPVCDPETDTPPA
jgi:hypothetical protein